MEYITFTNIKVIMAIHIVTWKYKLRIDSFIIGIAGTGPKNPIIKVYTSITIASIFHHHERDMELFFVVIVILAKDTETVGKKG